MTDLDPRREELRLAHVHQSTKTCPDCPHKIVDHTARSGDMGSVCAWCGCIHYGVTS